MPEEIAMQLVRPNRKERRRQAAQTKRVVPACACCIGASHRDTAIPPRPETD